MLGVGGVLTLAAWNSSEFTTGIFKTGAFALEGKNPQDPGFSSHPGAASAAQLSFSVDTTNMSPGDVVTAPFAVRLTGATTFDGSAVINTAVATPVTGLTQRVYTSAGTTCSGDCRARDCRVAGAGNRHGRHQLRIDQPRSGNSG